jgi:hypothetical protein
VSEAKCRCTRARVSVHTFLRVCVGECVPECAHESLCMSVHEGACSAHMSLQALSLPTGSNERVWERVPTHP